jgi:hypothetical protein
MSKIIRVLNLNSFKHLVYKLKLGFFNQLKNHPLTSSILENLLINKSTKKHNSKSYIADMCKISKYLLTDMSVITGGDPKIIWKNFCLSECGITDSIRTCLSRYNEPEFKNLLRLLTRSF